MPCGKAATWSGLPLSAPGRAAMTPDRTSARPATGDSGVNVLSVGGVHKSFAGVHALKGVSFDLAAGEVHALAGENGAGKSTLIRIITGAERAEAGSLQIARADVALGQISPAAARARGIAAIYQQPALFPDLTIAENIAVAIDRPPPWRAIDWRGRRNQAASCLERIGATLDPDRLVRTL